MRSKNIKTVLKILKDEVRGDAKSALSKMSPDYSMTWVYKSKSGKLFPRTKPDLKSEMKDVYKIEGRKYNIKNIAEGKNVVMVELVESYPNLETKRVHRTPIVLVLEMEGGKIRKGRHYCDPQLSYMNLSEKDLEKIYK